MPYGQFQSLHDPPPARDHTLANAWSVPVSAASIVIGIMVIVAQVFDLQFSLIVMVTPWQIAVPIGIAHLVGGAMVLYAVYENGESQMRPWRIERAGLTLSATVWSCWLVGSIFVMGAGTIMILSTSIIISCVIRIIAICIMMRRALDRQATREGR